MNDNGVEALIDVGSALSEVRTAGDMPFVIVPHEYSVRSLEDLLPIPTRCRGTVKLRDAKSFIATVKRFSGDECQIYGDLRVGSFVAVFNDHTPADPGWRDHRATFCCEQSVEWKRWTEADGKKMTQPVFAEFIEDNLPDIVDPVAATMLEISRTFEAKKKVAFQSSIRLSNGQHEFTYEESVSGTAAKGKLQIPESITLGLPVFDGGQPYAVEARLRYRIGDGGQLMLWFDLLRPHRIIEDAIKAVVSEIETATGLVILNGTP